MKIAIINSLDERYGSTYRIRAFRDALSKEHDVRYVESGGSAWQKLSLAFRTAAFDPYDILLTQKFNPITLACLLAAKLRGKVTIVDWDDWDVGLQPHFLKKILSSVCEKFGPYLAFHITTHNAAIRTHALRYAPVTDVLQGVDLQRFRPTESARASMREKWGYAENTFLIGHLCTFTTGGTLDIDVILKGWRDVRDPNVSFILIGGGPLHEEIGRKIYRFGVESRTRVTGLLPHEDVPEVLAMLDAGAVYMSDTPSNRARVSFKVIEYLAMNVPVVGKVVGETKRLLGNDIEQVDREEEFSVKMEWLATQRSKKNTHARMLPYDWNTTTLPLLELLRTIKEHHGTDL